MSSAAKTKWLQAVESINTTSTSFWDVVNELQLQQVNDLGEGGAKAVGLTQDGGLDLNFDDDWCKDVEAHVDESVDDSEEEEEEEAGEEREVEAAQDCDGLNIAIMVVGTRGDVQPFIALGIGLVEAGHRVRLAAHANFRDFVTSFGLEFFPLGGDPKVLSKYVVRNRGVLPMHPEDIPENRKQLRDIIFSTYPACTEPDVEGDGRKFVADAIIANPPTIGHIHCAEKLGVPLHMMFTMPWSKTKAFMHPLARITRSFATTFEGAAKAVLGERINRFIRRRMNYDTYSTVENLMFMGMKDIVDDFREEVLGLEATGMGSYYRHILDEKKIPFTYCWSPSLVPKPKDWGSHIDVVGFFFLNQTSRISYTPPDDLAKFLAEGKPPVYIGFGSMVIPDAEAINKCIVEAVSETGVRALVSKGWGGLGQGIDHPDVFCLGECPHDWLFPKCSGVVHHGGAGTTAAGLLSACPTLIVPFFGDQPFWGDACHKAGVGPKPVTIDDITTKKLTKAFSKMHLPICVKKAKEVSERMKKENGIKLAVDAFHSCVQREFFEVK